MPFDIALSGIRAASSELKITGNNIANASTTGFKASRAEFGDVYATSVLGAGLNQTGAGVSIQDISQQFTQGNISFTGRSLDLAANGNGFFVLSNDGSRSYTRAGTFGLDGDGFITSNNEARLQGYSADETGEIVRVISDLRVQETIIDPRQTTDVQQQLNLDAEQPVLQSIGRRIVAEGNVVANAQAGLQASTTSTALGAQSTRPIPNNFDTLNGGTAMTFDISLSNSNGTNGTTSITLDTTRGVLPTVSSINDLRSLASAINAQIFAPTPPQEAIGVVAEVVDLGGSDFQLRLRALEEGVGSIITVSNQSANANQLGLNATTFTQGIPAVNNGYPAQSIDITDPRGNTSTYTSKVGATAAETASELNSITGITATARTAATISNYVNQNGNLEVTINNVALTSTSLADLETKINALTNSTLPGVSSTFDAATNTLSLSASVGDDLRLSISSTDDGDAVSIQGNPGAAAQVLEVDAANDGLADPAALDASVNSSIVGGEITITVDENYQIGNESPLAIGLFQPLGNIDDPLNPVFNDIVINAFDPSDQNTYNSATSTTIFDSLGVKHVMTQFFVKEPFDESDATTAPNQWKMYVQIDGNNVGDPDVAAPDTPTLASYDLFFNEDGSLNTLRTNPILISNWNVVDENGEPLGALRPLPVLNGGSTNIPEPPDSSNFVIDIAGSTQYGAPFAVNSISQDGYTAGQFSGLTVDGSGIVFSRFTNGESLALGQVLLADFTNQQGLQPTGDTSWVETFESGTANINVPGTASLGAIQSGALEGANVDLSEQLVQLIISQRNFQASAKTIETADATTQTIINLR